MKVHLLFKDADYDEGMPQPWNQGALAQDLGLGVLLEAMAGKDRLVYDVCQKVLFDSLKDVGQVRYRQQVAEDCINNPQVAREMFLLAKDAIEMRKKQYWSTSSNRLSYLLHGSVRLLQMLRENLMKLRRIADAESGNFRSEGFRNLFGMLKEELDDAYLELMRTQLQELMFKDGVLMSSQLGKSNYGVNYVLRKPPTRVDRWLKWRFAPRYCVHERDESGIADLSRRKDRAVNNTANILAQAADHVVSFFESLMKELAFYIGCLNLEAALRERGLPTAFPEVDGPGSLSHSFKGLYDVSLALLKDGEVIGNGLSADSTDLFVITGANQGGKSTFLRGIGQAQLMMQSGMFVPAESFRSNIADGIYSHFKREEDAGLKSGKLDEELVRMKDIVDRIRPGAMVLFNESFASTNEREGSEISRQVVLALVERGIKVFFVTHQYDFARSMFERAGARSVFLRPERDEDETRTFRIIEGAPLPTSFGEDIYRRVFESSQER